MKHKIIFLLIIILPLISAVPTIQFQNDQTQPGETMLATISTPGEFMEQIEESQIKFFQGRREATLETDIMYHNETHYLYIYTTQEANLTLQIENILYREADTLQSTTITENITITKNILTDEDTNETYTQILKIKPGFIFTITNPTLKLINIGTTQLNLTFNEEEISIESLATHEIEFTPEETFSLAKISTYKDFLIPTVYLSATENTSFVSPITENTSLVSPEIKADLRQSPDLLLVEISIDAKSEETIELFNFGDEELTELKIISTLDFIKIKELQDMPGRGVQNMTLELSPKTIGHFQGSINISYTQNETQNTLEIPLSIFVLPEGTTKEDFTQSDEKCEDLGQVCGSDEICNGEADFTDSFTKYCCFASCISDKEESESSGFGWIIAIAIFAILGFGGYYLYKKQKQLQAPTSKDALQTTTEKFEKRLAGNKSQRTTGNITKS